MLNHFTYALMYIQYSLRPKHKAGKAKKQNLIDVE